MDRIRDAVIRFPVENSDPPALLNTRPVRRLAPIIQKLELHDISVARTRRAWNVSEWPAEPQFPALKHLILTTDGGTLASAVTLTELLTSLSKHIGHPDQMETIDVARYAHVLTIKMQE